MSYHGWNSFIGVVIGVVNNGENRPRSVCASDSRLCVVHLTLEYPNISKTLVLIRSFNNPYAAGGSFGQYKTIQKNFKNN